MPFSHSTIAHSRLFLFPISQMAFGLLSKSLTLRTMALFMCALGISVTAQSSCADVLSLNAAAASGIYNITTRSSGTSLPVYCDNTREGGGWTQVFRHFFPEGGLFDYGQIDANVSDPISSRYSILSFLEEFKFVNGPFEFLMEWPGNLTQSNLWRQFSLTSSAPVGFDPVSIAYPDKQFQGLRISIRDHWQSYLSGSATSWAFALAQSGTYGKMLYGPYGPVPTVRLFVRAVECHASCHTCKSSLSSGCLSCRSGFSLAANLGQCVNVTGLIF